MKKILVTGAAGTVGLQVIRFLLSEGKYEITALDLKNKHNYKRLKHFKKRINIVFGDVNDDAIVDALIKTHDVVIHLAGVLPPFANIREDLCKEIDYKGTQNIVDAISNYNPGCYLLYASSTSVYGSHDKDKLLNVKSDCKYDNYDFYSKYKLKAEKYIQKNIKNYSIFRLAYVLGDPDKETMIYNVKADSNVEMISSEDAGYAFVAAIDYQKELNKKIYNVSGGDKFRIVYRDYLKEVFKTYGLSWKFMSTYLLAEKNYNIGHYSDGDKLDDLLHFRSKNIDVYYRSLEKYKHKVSRLLPRLFALPYLIVNRKK